MSRAKKTNKIKKFYRIIKIVGAESLEEALKKEKKVKPYSADQVPKKEPRDMTPAIGFAIEYEEDDY